MIVVRGKNNTSQQVLSTHFNYLLLGIPAFTAPRGEPTSAAHPITYTHSHPAPISAESPQKPTSWWRKARVM